MDLPARLDRLVHVTRLDSLTSYGRRPSYAFRWLPLVALAMLAGGYALSVTVGRYGAPLQGNIADTRLFVAGTGLFVTGMVISVILMFLGPRFRNWSPTADEREREVESRAGDLSGRLLAGGASLACFYFGFATLFGLWMPQESGEWSMLGVALMVVPWLLRIWIASWMQPRLEEEDA